MAFTFPGSGEIPPELSQKLLPLVNMFNNNNNTYFDTVQSILLSPTPIRAEAQVSNKLSSYVTKGRCYEFKSTAPGSNASFHHASVRCRPYPAPIRLRR